MATSQLVLAIGSGLAAKAITSHGPGSDEARARALAAYHAQNRLNDKYTYILSAIIGFVLLAGTIRNIWLHVQYKRMRRKLNGNSHTKLSKAAMFVRQYVTLPALVGENHIRHPKYHGNPYAVPRRINAILLVAFILLNFFFCVFGFSAYNGNMLYLITSNLADPSFPGPTYYQYLRYFANRIGSLSFANTPLLITLAGRNNIFIWMTGWSFDTFQVYHRWIARIVLSQATAHVIAYTLYLVLPGNDDRPGVYLRQWLREYWLYGVLAYFLLWALCTHSLRIFRKHHYELFVFSHIVMVLIYFIGLFIHVFHRLKVEWLWISVAFWVFDRSVRVIRILWLNIPWRHPSRGFSTAEIHCLSGDVMRVTLHVAQPWKYSPGQSIYIYFPTIRYSFWQSHPFSILGCSPTISSKIDVQIPYNDLNTTGDDDDKIYEVPLLQNQQPETKQFHLLVKAQTGLTRRIRNKALSTEPCRLPIFIEGPYGISHEFDMFPSVLFIAGGVAVTYTMSNLVHLVQQKSNNPKMRVQKIHHIWVIKELDNMEWIGDELEKISELNIPNDFLKMSFFISHATTNDQIASCGPKLANIKIEMFAGRANVPGMIAKEVEERLGTLAVVVCGPGGLADQARKGVIDNLDSANGEIEYFEEAFGW